MTATPESAALGGLDGVEIKLNFDAAQIDDANARLRAQRRRRKAAPDLVR
jgi:hypothetical protein